MKIIAEIGVNHGGNYNKCLEMIYEAKRCGATSVKTQLYYTDTLCLNRDCFQTYNVLEQNKTHPSWIPLLKRECDNLGIEFLCTPFCKYSLEEISPYVDSIKIASPEVCNIDFVKEAMKYNKQLILSTGKATLNHLDEIFSMATVPIILLYCVSRYPALQSDYDLNLVDMLKTRYRCPVGLSDHTQGITVSKAAINKGIKIIERHFKLDNKCIDANVSLTSTELTALVKYTKGV